MSETPSSGDSSSERNANTHRRIVRERYSNIATDNEGSSCCDPSPGDGDSCCEGSAGTDSEQLGYAAEDVEAVAGDSDLGLGCGNPKAIADLETGETVLDLGSGAGFDCFLAAREVGSEGRVIGVDMTPEMIETARENVDKNDATNVEFRLGEIEHLPVGDTTVDVIISNCVINLSPAKPQVFSEAFRVLVPDGRVAVSDVVLTTSLPKSIKTDPDSLAACVTGASTVDKVEQLLKDAGFVDVRVELKDDSAGFISEWDSERDMSEYIVSATIEARKPPAEQA